MLLAGLIYSALTGRIIASLIGFAIGFGIMFFGFCLGQTAGGDVKLAGAIGVWLGTGIILATFIASLIGLAWSFIRLYKAGLLKTRIIHFFKGIFFTLVYGMKGAISISKLPEDENTPLPPDAVPFGTCLAIGAWITFILVRMGLISFVWR